ncbi:fimbrial protein YehD [Escherichia marmotae]|uniref:Fimbrial protein YehD n=1 Tax=Escherichia marmotae TaxID=1499973 RepID=A0A7L5X4A2_9ESCH|nr:fimbrial protein YehD [Escherichia marmotae]EFO1591918.1 fimbrial protein YehD [Escherichia coli]MDQ9208313.1 fimbrial protein YehD [Escherichia marmotae]MDQ9304053.1 fimbrial protein YehD [Escherichia marmotae]MDZ3932126.1 fimbrial protein YehD [Escherichia marmotae]MDZ5520723.1 fimbrial protein YehD [Escherichia marmotae]
MKRSIIAVAVLSSLFMSAGNAAETATSVEQGELIITGKVVGTTCKFTEGTTATIAMNEIGEDQFKGLSKGGILEAYSNKTTVPLKVECYGEKAPRITFSSSQFTDEHDNITINTASENGAGFAVYYMDGDEEKPITKKESIDLTGKGNDNKYILHFRAKYAKAGAEVTSGPVNSALTMTVVTD